MNRNIVSIVIFVLIMLLVVYTLFTALNKPTAYAPTTDSYTLESDLEELDKSDLNSIDTNLEQLDKESSSI